MYDEDDYGNGGDDDDDTSWKVRKAAVKTLHALAVVHAQSTPALFQSCIGDLIDRVKEREETVRLDVIACFVKFVECSPSTVVSDLLTPRVDKIVQSGDKQLTGPSMKTKEAVLTMYKALVIALHVSSSCPRMVDDH
jgi:hypothetical protein